MDLRAVLNGNDVPAPAAAQSPSLLPSLHQQQHQYQHEHQLQQHHRQHQQQPPPPPPPPQQHRRPAPPPPLQPSHSPFHSPSPGRYASLQYTPHSPYSPSSQPGPSPRFPSPSPQYSHPSAPPVSPLLQHRLHQQQQQQQQGYASSPIVTPHGAPHTPHPLSAHSTALSNTPTSAVSPSLHSHFPPPPPPPPPPPLPQPPAPLRQPSPSPQYPAVHQQYQQQQQQQSPRSPPPSYYPAPPLQLYHNPPHQHAYPQPSPVSSPVERLSSIPPVTDRAPHSLGPDRPPPSMGPFVPREEKEIVTISPKTKLLPLTDEDFSSGIPKESDDSIAHRGMARPSNHPHKPPPPPHSPAPSQQQQQQQHSQHLQRPQHSLHPQHSQLPQPPSQQQQHHVQQEQPQRRHQPDYRSTSAMGQDRRNDAMEVDSAPPDERKWNSSVSDRIKLNGSGDERKDERQHPTTTTTTATSTTTATTTPQPSSTDNHNHKNSITPNPQSPHCYQMSSPSKDNAGPPPASATEQTQSRPPPPPHPPTQRAAQPPQTNSPISRQPTSTSSASSASPLSPRPQPPRQLSAKPTQRDQPTDGQSNSPSSSGPPRKRLRGGEAPIWAQKASRSSSSSPVMTNRRQPPPSTYSSQTPQHSTPVPLPPPPPSTPVEQLQSRPPPMQPAQPGSFPYASGPRFLPGFGPWEPNIINTEQYEEMTRQVAEFLFQHVVLQSDPALVTGDSKGPVIEIEAKLGQLVDRNTGDRLRLPVRTETIFDHTDRNWQVQFKSSMTDVQHRHLNTFLNRILTESRVVNAENGMTARVPLSYVHTHERDSFYDLPADMHHILPASIRAALHPRHSLRVRVTTDNSGQVIRKIIKTRIADLNVYSPLTMFDWRVSVNMEMPFSGDHEKLHPISDGSRAKDRVSYRQTIYRVDLTQVTGKSPRREHELEVEVDGAEIRKQGLMAKDKKPNSYEDLVKGLVDNVRVLIRAVQPSS